MATSKTYLVPIDFSRGSKIALKHALRLARENKGKLLLVHIVPPLIYPSEAFLPNYYPAIEKRSREDMGAIALRLRLKPREYRSIVVQRMDPARTIADLAKRFRAAMIVMGSHGRTGFQRLTLGSVAERTLRYSQCPVLVVKK